MPAGKVIAIAAMPTAVLMGMGFTPTLAQADDQPASRNLTADEFKECLEVVEEAGKGDATASSTPASTPSATPDGTPSPDRTPSTGPLPSHTAPNTPDTPDTGSDRTTGRGTRTGSDAGTHHDPDAGTGNGSSSGTPPDAGSDDTSDTPPARSTAGGGQDGEGKSGYGQSLSDTGRNLLEGVGNTLEDILTRGDRKGEETVVDPDGHSSAGGSGTEAGAGGTPAGQTEGTPAGQTEGGKDGGTSGGKAGEASGKTVPQKLEGTERNAGSANGKDGDKSGTEAGEQDGGRGEKRGEKEEAQGPPDEPTKPPGATASPSVSATPGMDPDDCPIATDAEGGIDNAVDLPDQPWFLEAGSLLLKDADYQGIVEVRTANGTVKKVLKYVISGGTDIGDLHQKVRDEQAGVTYHVQAAKGSTSTIRDGDTLMYTESISGDLFGLIPVTFDPEHPPPLNIPLIYFTDVTVRQAGQFGGTLHIPGLHQYTTD